MFDHARLSALTHRLLWEADPRTLPRWKRTGLQGLRIGYAVARDLSDGQLTLRAMSLVYTTLLSLVPLLAVSFSVLKAFGVHNQVEPMLLNLTAALGDKSIEITGRIIEFVDNIKAGLLGSLGLAFLIYTVISLIQKIEGAFNYTWHVRRARPFAQRFSDYLSVILVGPVLVFSALGLTASLASTSLVQQIAAYGPMSDVIAVLGRLVPLLLITAAFTFVYVFMPNTRVRVRSALVGAVVAGALWQTTGWLFASFVVGSVKYTAIYSAFATLMMFMIWLYLSWLILLLGASIAFYHQHPEYVGPNRAAVTLSNRVKEKLALTVMALVGGHFQRQEPPWSVEGLARHVRVPSEAVDGLVQELTRHNILVCTAGEPPTYQPARPLESIPLAELLSVVRGGGETPHLNEGRMQAPAAVGEVMQALDAHRVEALAGRTARDLTIGTTTAPTVVARRTANEKAPPGAGLS